MHLVKGNCDIDSADYYRMSLKAGSDYYKNNPTLTLRQAIDQARTQT